MKLKIKCDFCGMEFERYKSQIKNRKHLFCSKQCNNEWQLMGLKGKNNPNYGNIWNDRQRKRQSDLMNKRYENPQIRWNAGKSNRGKKFSKERIEKMHGHRTKESYSNPRSDETKRLIGIKSSEKFTNEYKIKFRKTMEEQGSWIPLHEMDDYKLYNKFANWNERMFDLIYNTQQQTLLTEYGVFNAKINKRGVVRDHMYSRRSGFEFKVFPEILRHPANCRLILHSENVRTSRNKHISDNILTLNNLFENIKKYTLPWHEQDICNKLISKYECGNRYNKEKYIENYYK